MDNTVCAHVWELTNPEGGEIFTKPMFLMAMHLMYKKKKDSSIVLPTSIPVELRATAFGSAS